MKKKKSGKGSSSLKSFLTALLVLAGLAVLVRLGGPAIGLELLGARAPTSDTIATAVELRRVVDGDTVEVVYRGAVEKVRLLRVNTPERNETGYREATSALTNLLAGKALSLEHEKEGRVERDRYGRILAYLVAGGQNVNVELVEEGWSRFYRKYGEGRLAPRFAAAETRARKKNLGLWKNGAWSSVRSHP